MVKHYLMINSFVLVAVAAMASTPYGAEAATSRTLMDDQIVAALENLRDHMAEGWPDLGVPPLDPLSLEHVDININKNGTIVKKNPRDESVNNYFDLVFANLRQSITENGQDPVILPGDSDNFTVTLFNRTLDGRMEAGPGKLVGLSTLHRAGDMELQFVGLQGEVVWKGEVGLIDLEVDYRLGLTLPLFGKEFSFSAILSFVQLSFETDVFIFQSEIVLPYCNITDLGPVHFKEKGSGPLDTSLYNALINLLLGKLEGLVTTAVEDTVCSLLEDALTSSS